MYTDINSLPDYANATEYSVNSTSTISPNSAGFSSNGWIQLRSFNCDMHSGNSSSGFAKGGYVQIRIKGKSIRDYYYEVDSGTELLHYSHNRDGAYSGFDGENFIEVSTNDTVSVGAVYANNASLNSYVDNVSLNYTFIPKKTS